MNGWTAGGALAAGLVTLMAGTGLRAPAGAQGGPAWLDSYPQAQAAAKQSGKPIFLVFR